MAREMVNLSDKLEKYKQLDELQDKYDVSQLLKVVIKLSFFFYFSFN